jgi:hypothetical protein
MWVSNQIIRPFLTGLCLLTALSQMACRSAKMMSGAHGKRVVVLGIDGMDPGFLEKHWADLPNMDRLRR